jgi:hypothetical protein
MSEFSNTPPSNETLNALPAEEPGSTPVIVRPSKLGIIKNVALFFIVAMGVMMAYHFIRILSLWGDTTAATAK